MTARIRQAFGRELLGKNSNRWEPDGSLLSIPLYLPSLHPSLFFGGPLLHLSRTGPLRGLDFFPSLSASDIALLCCQRFCLVRVQGGRSIVSAGTYHKGTNICNRYGNKKVFFESYPPSCFPPSSTHP